MKNNAVEVIRCYRGYRLVLEFQEGVNDAWVRLYDLGSRLPLVYSRTMPKADAWAEADRFVANGPSIA